MSDLSPFVGEERKSNFGVIRSVDGPKPEVDAPKHPTFAADLPVFGRFETVRDSSTQASDVMLSSAALVSKICGDQIKELLLPGQDHLIFFELRLLMQDRT